MPQVPMPRLPLRRLGTPQGPPRATLRITARARPTRNTPPRAGRPRPPPSRPRRMPQQGQHKGSRLLRMGLHMANRAQLGMVAVHPSSSSSSSSNSSGSCVDSNTGSFPSSAGVEYRDTTGAVAGRRRAPKCAAQQRGRGRGAAGHCTKTSATPPCPLNVNNGDGEEPDPGRGTKRPAPTGDSDCPEKRLFVASFQHESLETLQVLVQASGAEACGDRQALMAALWEVRQQHAPTRSAAEEAEAERNCQRLERMAQEEAELRQQLQQRLAAWPHLSPFFPISDLLGLVVVRYALPRETTVNFGPPQLQDDLQLRIMPLNFDLRPTVWMEPLSAEGMAPVYMELAVGPHRLSMFPPNWGTRRRRTHVTALSMDITPFCDCAAATQHIAVRFPSAGDHMCWEGVLAIVAVREASAAELVDAVADRDPLPSLPAEVDEECRLVVEQCSLLDPLTLHRIHTPVKGLQCTHRACFDLQTYLLSSHQQNVWICPVCLEPCPYQALRVDELFHRILNDSELRDCPGIHTVLVCPTDLSHRFCAPVPCDDLDD
eukprot:GGOE01014730.1.p2 GENE.GGOE01014730.1~~GGOE01014730.1.p2  ORF type:complete len:545 (+),score=108.05 GGOE01014730.1:469-2103(+)